MSPCNAALSRHQSMGFPLGRLLITHGAQQALLNGVTSPMDLLYRHQSGDWGNLCPEDRDANERALRNGGRIMSVYTLYEMTLWVITEADRGSTTILLPEDY